MRKKNYLLISIFFIFCSKIYSQDTILISYPSFPNEWTKSYKKITLTNDDKGQLISIKNATGENNYIQYDNNSIFVKKENGEVIDLSPLYAIDNKPDTFTITTNNGVFKWKFENGVLLKYNNMTGIIETFYIYTLENSLYQISCYNAFDFANRLGYTFNQMVYECEGMFHDYQYSKELVLRLRKNHLEINENNAKILLYFNLPFLIPFILSYNDVITTPINYYASSELNENGILYKADNLKTKDGLPWVSANGKGIKDKITIKLPAADGTKIAFLNGYQSDSRPDLYKSNSRARIIQIKNIETGLRKTIVLEDSTSLQIFDLDELWINLDLYKTLEFTIEDVYCGEKYDDLCIQAILPIY